MYTRYIINFLFYILQIVNFYPEKKKKKKKIWTPFQIIIFFGEYFILQGVPKIIDIPAPLKKKNNKSWKLSKILPVFGNQRLYKTKLIQVLGQW